MRDIAAGEIDLLSKILDSPSDVYSLAQQMNQAANTSPSKELGEFFAPATLHGRATGDVLKTNCPSGQFWDPDGNCYSCPRISLGPSFP